MKIPHKILVALDSSPMSEEILAAVGERQWLPGSQIRLISIMRPAGGDDVTREYMHQARIIHAERVAGLAKRLYKCAVGGECSEGSAPEVILKTANSWKAELIVIGSHGDTGPRQNEVGSVAAMVVNQAPCSVFVVKIKQATEPQTLTAKVASLKN